MHYVYMLRSIKNPKKTYIGHTDDVEARLVIHNDGGSPYTARHRPWELITYIAVQTELKAIRLETYLKSGSGHAIARKHLW